MLYLLSLCIISAFVQVAQAAETIKSSAGLELGGNGSLLLSDPSTGAFGVGAGLQGSVFFTMWDDHPLSAKLRFERVSLREDSVQKTPADYLLPGYSLKTLGQNWTLISAGIEKNFVSQGQIFFWEALLGYAIGGGSTITLTPSSPDKSLNDTPQTTSSGFCVSGGIGIERIFSKTVTGIMTLRTLFVIAPTYSTLPNHTLVPLPLLFNIGAQFPFEL